LCSGCVWKGSKNRWRMERQVTCVIQHHTATMRLILRWILFLLREHLWTSLRDNSLGIRYEANTVWLPAHCPWMSAPYTYWINYNDGDKWQIFIKSCVYKSHIRIKQNEMLYWHVQGAKSINAVIMPTDCYPAVLSRIYVIGCCLSFIPTRTPDPWRPDRHVVSKHR
jgi:hypothetical protein